MILIVFSISLFIVILSLLELTGVICHNEIFARAYEVKGIDVSHYQNNIEWNKVSKKFKFVFIKATEGKDYVDPTFNKNWYGAKENGFLVGAYHFFVTSSSGEKQAKNYIETVPDEENSLPAVIDLEIDTGKNREKVRKHLAVMIEMFTEKYGKAPILYVTYDTYDAYVKGYFNECYIWIRDIVKQPKLSDGREWTFWQYCSRGRIKGIDTYVDLNVFHSTEEELVKLTRKVNN